MRRLLDWPGVAPLILGVLFSNALAAQPIPQSGIPITVSAPGSVRGVHSWPVSVGIPFPSGTVTGFQNHAIVDEATQRPVPCQIDNVAFWPDNSVRWARADFIADPAHSYKLRAAARASFLAVTVKQSSSGVTVTTGPARYFFPAGAAMFDRVELDLNNDKVFQPSETIISGAQGAFYVLDSTTGQRAALGNGTLTIESSGPLHAIVRAEGTYTSAGARRAAAVVYYHFYAGLPQVRVSHKLIITEDTETSWLFQSGLSIPFSAALPATASVNNDHDRPLAVTTNTLRAGDEMLMSQLEFAHHDHDATRSAIELTVHGSTSTGAPNAMAGDWADLSDSRVGLTMQVPAFAEQAPKAFRITPTALTVELWSDHGGLELDFRRGTVYGNYFQSWLDASSVDAHHLSDANSSDPSNGTGTAKVHDIWLYPHAGAVQPSTLGATRQEIVGRADPAWIVASGVFGPIHAYDPAGFGDTEAAIDDYYTRSVFISQRVFPQTGYFFYGQYPYVAQPWHFHGGRWYPDWHRLARQMDYDLRRSVWILWARGGDRKYYDFARRNTRFFGDYVFSNWDVSYKPKGWSTEGHWHSAIPWGHYARGTPSYSSNSAASLADDASSEDVIQFVYDYFLTGDLHSRDVARNWKRAMLTAMGLPLTMNENDVTEPALNEAVQRVIDYDPSGSHQYAFNLPYLFLRLVGSIYELEHDPVVMKFGHAVLDRLADNGGTDNILNPAYRTNFVKQLEAISAYYYYWISTADKTAQMVLLRYADFAYRFGRIDGFFNRHNGAVPMAFAIAYAERHDPSVATYLAHAVHEYGRDTRTLASEGRTEASFSASNSLSWSPEILDEQAAVGIGLPLAMAVTADAMAHGTLLPVVPYVDKPIAAQPTYIVFEKGTGAARIDLSVIDIGSRGFDPILSDSTGHQQSFTVLARQEHREIEAPAGQDPGNRQWSGMVESQIFLSLAISPTLPAGTYSLDLGRDVSARVLYTDLGHIEQVAPDGIVVSPGSALFFSVPKTTSPVDLFAYRGIRVFDWSSPTATTHAELPTTKVDPSTFGTLRFTPSGGPFSLVPGSDQYFNPSVTSGETFVRFLNVPPVVASGESSRLFAVDHTRFPSQLTTSLPAAISGGSDYAPGIAGDSIILYRSAVDVPAPAGFPLREGTIEFWMRPLWSTTDFPIDRRRIIDPTTVVATQMAKRIEFFSAPPFHLTYTIDLDSNGRGPRYVISQLKLLITGLQHGNDATDSMVLKYPTRLYMQQGRWYHIAVTWKLDGTASDIALFVNGREKSFEIFDEDLEAVHANMNYVGGTPPAPPASIRFGAGRPCTTTSYCDPPGEQFDELRISTTRRYLRPLGADDADFTPPTGPFTADAQTYLLMHFDHTLAIDVGGTTATVVNLDQ